MDLLEHKLDRHLQQSLPFVLYSKPDSPELIGVFQNDYEWYTVSDYSEAGFVVQSFYKDSSVLFPLDKSTVCSFDLQTIVSNTSVKPLNDEAVLNSAHEALVAKAIEAIRRGEFDKVVISRKEIITLKGYDFMLFFKRILKLYPSAFCYCFFHPKVGFWMGATPEQLLKKQDNIVSTVALASTQLYKGTVDVHWTEKEYEEQQIVTDYIVKVLLPFSRDIQVTKPYVQQAGNLLHLKTNIKANLNEGDLSNVLEALHPTPALCGSPKNQSLQFLIENEGYDREFYGGFLGELNYDKKGIVTNSSDLFVNLRCMQLHHDEVVLYVGGGITKDSDPELEYIETINKTRTLKNILG